MDQHMEDFKDVASLLGGKQQPKLELKETSTIEWTEYDWAITVSPKSSPLLSNPCVACNQSIGHKTIDQQFEIMEQMCNEMIKVFKDKVSFFFRPELYRDNLYLHYHGYLRSKYKSSNKIVKFISNFFELKNISVKLKAIDDLSGWNNYVYKDFYKLQDQYSVTGLQYDGYKDKSQKISKSIKRKPIKSKTIPNSLKHWYSCEQKNKCDICSIFYDKYKDKMISEDL